MTSVKKIGVVAMPLISVGGGFARVTRDLIAALNSLDKEIYLLTPFEVNMEKINELYGPIKIKKIYYPSKEKSFFCREDSLGRKLIKKEFIKMANEVDLIIDMDGLVLHRYLPKNFDKSKYIIWRVSCPNFDSYKIQKIENSKTLMKILIRNFMQKIILNKKDFPKGVRIFPLDEWTKKEIIEFWKIRPKKTCLYPEIKVEEFDPYKRKEKKIVIFGRISANKSIGDSIKIFFHGTKKYLDYKLIILGGVTPDSEKYIGKLKELINKLGISNRVSIIKDPSFEKIKEVLSKSKILIDSQKGVSLTMTAIESMASGCIVLAHKNGGTYTEILGKEKFGYGFTNIKEGKEQLEMLLKKAEKGKLSNKKSIQRSQDFSGKNFIKRLRKIIDGK